MTTTSFDTALSRLGVQRTGASAANTATADTSQQMDQNDFLQLMTAQLKNQDPFEPVDNSQMVAQMAQFSSLAGISEMNSTLKAISERLGTTSSSDMMSWVGRTVLTEGSTAYPRTDGTVGGTLDLSAAAANVTVSIQDASGQVLKTVELGPQNAGAIDFEWDGSTDSGDPAGAGPFTIRATARNADGGNVKITSLVWAPVTSVTMGTDGVPLLTLPGIGQVSANSVRKVG